MKVKSRDWEVWGVVFPLSNTYEKESVQLFSKCVWLHIKKTMIQITFFFQSKKILIHCYYHFTSMLTHFKRKIWFLLNLLKYVLFMFLTRHEEHQGLYFVVCISVTYYYLFVLCYKGLIWVWISFSLTHLRSRKQFKETRTFKLSTQCEQTSAFCKDCFSHSVSQSNYVTLCVFNNVKGILHFFLGNMLILQLPQS